MHDLILKPAVSSTRGTMGALLGTLAVGIAIPVNEILAASCLVVLAVSLILGRPFLLGILFGSSFVWLAPPVRGVPTGLLAALIIATFGSLAAFNYRPNRLRILPIRRSALVLAMPFLGLIVSTALDGATSPGLMLDLELMVLLTILAVSRPLFAQHFPDDGFVAVTISSAIASSWLVWARTNEAIGQSGVGLGRRVSTEFGASNYLVAFTALVFFLAVAAAVDRLLPIAYVLLAGFPFFSLVIRIGSRSAAVSTALFLILLVIGDLRRRDIRRRRAFGALLCVASGAIAILSGQSLLSERLQNLDPSGRNTLFAIAAESIQAHALLGIGSNGLVKGFQDEGIFGLYSHNFVLTFLARYGIPFGLLLSTVFLPRLGRKRGTLEIALVGAVLISLLEPAIDTLRLGFLYVIFLTICDVRGSAPQDPSPVAGKSQIGAVKPEVLQ